MSNLIGGVNTPNDDRYYENLGKEFAFETTTQEKLWFIKYLNPLHKVGISIQTESCGNGKQVVFWDANCYPQELQNKMKEKLNILESYWENLIAKRNS